jgi:hypothetical protein
VTDVGTSCVSGTGVRVCRAGNRHLGLGDTPRLRAAGADEDANMVITGPPTADNVTTSIVDGGSPRREYLLVRT